MKIGQLRVRSKNVMVFFCYLNLIHLSHRSNKMKRLEKKWNVEVIREKIATDNRWLLRGLLAIHSYQTTDEKSCKQAIHHNKCGFNKADAGLLSSYAEVLKSGGTFTDGMLTTARRRMTKYATQLTRIANANRSAEA
jgi:hypothetical protein